MPNDLIHAIAFAGTRRIAEGPLPEVADRARQLRAAEPSEAILVFDLETSKVLDLDLRAEAGEIAPTEPKAAVAADPDRPRGGPGRPKLGVVAREVTLLPRHWEWLNDQPGGASVTLRKLVEQARQAGTDTDRVRKARESAYRFMAAMAGDLPGFEEAARALFAGDARGFDDRTAEWPADVRTHARLLMARSLG